MIGSKDLLNQPQYTQHEPANYFKQIKPFALIALIFFFLGVLVCGLFCINLTTKAMAKIIEGNTHTTNHFNPDYAQALKNYEEAQKIWPFLQYDHSFISEVSNIKTKAQRLSKKPSVIIYMKDNTKNYEVEQFIHALSTIQGVGEVQYIPQETALNNYIEKIKNDPILLELATADLFPKSIEVYLTDRTVKNKVVTFAQSKTFVDRFFSF